MLKDVKRGRKKIELPIEEIVKKWEQGVTQKELSKKYGGSQELISKRIIEYYEKEEKEKPKRKTKQRIKLPVEEIVEKWEQGTTQKELSKEYGVSDDTVKKRISEYYEKEGKEKPKRKPKRRINLPVDEIVKKWGQGVTQKDLSKEYGVSEALISKRISEYYEKEGKEKPKQRINLPIDEIVKKLGQGVTQKDLSKEYGVSEALINKRIFEYYEKEGKEKPKQKPKQRINLPVEEIVEKWEQGTTQKELSKEYGVSDNTIEKRISEYYEKEGKEKPKRKTKRRINLPVDEIVKKWGQGITQKELSKEYGVSDGTIKKRISEYYRKKENNEKKLRVLKSSSIIVEYLRKGLTIEQIESSALKQNIIVPQEVIEKAIQKIEQPKANKTNESNER